LTSRSQAQLAFLTPPFLALGSLAFSLSSLFNGNGDAIPLALDVQWKMGFFNGEICFPLGVVFRRIS